MKDLAAQKAEVTRLQSELDKISRDISDLKNIEIDKLKKDKTAKDNELKRLKVKKKSLAVILIKSRSSYRLKKKILVMKNNCQIKRVIQDVTGGS